MQCGTKHFPEYEREPRAAKLDQMTTEERKSIPSRNLVSKRYQSKFGYLASIGAINRNKNFKAKRIRNDFMFVCAEKDDDVFLKSTDRIFQRFKEVHWKRNSKK